MVQVCENRTVRALGLCSGGLDSILSALLLRYQGIRVHWISFETPFFSSEKAKYAAKKNNIPLYVKNITKTYVTMMKNPECKFGKNMNPCMDCHSLMFRLAGKIMFEESFDFMFSGEVLGQRPMSQNRDSLRYVEKRSGYDGHILRPLSARVLSETVPEKTKIVDRELLLGISGRSRKKQIELADKFNLKDYPAPGGGCLLTDKSYCNRLRDLFTHQIIHTENQLHLLKFGRHMRLNDRTKIIIGRNRGENESIKYYANLEHDVVLKTCEDPGPVVLVSGGKIDADIVNLAASICAGYSKTRCDLLAKINISYGNSQEEVNVDVISPHKSRNFLIL